MGLMKTYSRENRKHMTTSENEFKKKLQRHKIVFRSQRPCNNYIVDFLLPEYRLIIEIDGDYHYTTEMINKDKIRDKFFENIGFKTIRIKNSEVFNGKANFILEQIKKLPNQGYMRIQDIFYCKY